MSSNKNRLKANPIDPRPNVLIVDDDPAIRALLGAHLKRLALDVSDAADGASALAKAFLHKFDLIILDVDMHGMDGYTVCRKLKADLRTATAAVIFLTGSITSQQKVRGLELGAIDYIGKPFDIAELEARVNSALRVKQAHDLLARQSMVDGLTGLWNRSYFDLKLFSTWSDAKRHREPLCAIMLDIDHFKTINDSYGHMVGDDVLCRVADAISTTCRASDIACRFGGDEFAVIAPKTSSSQVTVFAERIRFAIAAVRVIEKGMSISIHASIGTAEARPGELANDPSELICSADKALYMSKREGKNRVTSLLAARIAA